MMNRFAAKETASPDRKLADSAVSLNRNPLNNPPPARDAEEDYVTSSVSQEMNYSASPCVHSSIPTVSAADFLNKAEHLYGYTVHMRESGIQVHFPQNIRGDARGADGVIVYNPFWSPRLSMKQHTLSFSPNSAMVFDPFISRGKAMNVCEMCMANRHVLDLLHTVVPFVNWNRFVYGVCEDPRTTSRFFLCVRATKMMDDAMYIAIASVSFNRRFILVNMADPRAILLNIDKLASSEVKAMIGRELYREFSGKYFVAFHCYANQRVFPEPFQPTLRFSVEDLFSLECGAFRRVAHLSLDQNGNMVVKFDV